MARVAVDALFSAQDEIRKGLQARNGPRQGMRGGQCVRTGKAWIGDEDRLIRARSKSLAKSLLALRRPHGQHDHPSTLFALQG